MKFKHEYLKEEFAHAPYMLREKAFFFERLSLLFNIEPVITRIKEQVSIKESGVHQDYRAIDFRDEHNGVFLYTHTMVCGLLNMVNARFPRVDGHNTMIHHGGTAEHFHLQIPSEEKYVQPKGCAVA